MPPDNGFGKPCHAIIGASQKRIIRFASRIFFNWWMIRVHGLQHKVTQSHHQESQQQNTLCTIHNAQTVCQFTMLNVSCLLCQKEDAREQSRAINVRNYLLKSPESTGLPIILSANGWYQLIRGVGQEHKFVFVSTEESNPFLRFSYYVAIPLSNLHCWLVNKHLTQTLCASTLSIANESVFTQQE